MIGILNAASEAIATAHMVVSALKLAGWVGDLDVGSLVNRLHDGRLADTLRLFQRWHGLLATGVLDGPTKRAILAPRFCAVSDRLAVTNGEPEEFKWPGGEVRWFVTNPGGAKHSPSNILECFDAAWTRMTRVCGLRAQNAARASEANCVVTFGRIDGGNGTLAWSNLADDTESTKEQRYDSDENFSLLTSDKAPSGTISLPTVLDHENMHMVGIGHAPPTSGALIAPTYSPRVPTFTEYDIRELQRRYGPPRTTGPVPVDPTGSGTFTVPCEVDPANGTIRLKGVKISQA